MLPSVKASAFTYQFQATKCAYSVFNTPKHVTALLKPRLISASTVTDGSPFGKYAAKKTHNGEPAPFSPPKLFEVPALPFVGSLITMHSGHPLPNLEQPYLYLPSNRKKYGDFYTVGMPGMGVGLFARVYYLTDANEYMKVLRQEGQFPFGAIQIEWPLINYLHSVGSALMDEENGYFGQGSKWKRQRRFLQTDLLSPSAAKGYVPGMIQAAQIASKGLVDFRSEVNKFMLWSSFDMFSSIMFGEITGVANPKSNPDPENIKFCNASVEAQESIFPMMMKPHIKLLLKLGLKPATYRHFEEQFSISRRTAKSKLETFRKRKEQQDITEAESASYFSRAIDRLQNDPDLLSDDELAEIGVILLVGSVDTTSSLLNWCIIHLAMNPIVQESLYQEISNNVSKSKEGHLTEMMLSKAASPLLHAIVRENHRMTPALTMSLVKLNTQAALEIHGVTIPKGNMIALDSYSIGMDPEYVPDFNTFRPERWFDEEVKRRAGTPAEVIDHPLYRDPFSAGSRKCPGSRVANYEVLVMISQLLLDWKISFEDKSINSLDAIQRFQGLTVQPKVPKLEVIPRF